MWNELGAMGLTVVCITAQLSIDVRCVHIPLQSRHPHLSGAGNTYPSLSSLAVKSELCRESHLVMGMCGLSLLP